jgi:hypothetical protein
MSSFGNDQEALLIQSKNESEIRPVMTYRDHAASTTIAAAAAANKPTSNVTDMSVVNESESEPMLVHEWHADGGLETDVEDAERYLLGRRSSKSDPVREALPWWKLLVAWQILALLITGTGVFSELLAAR